MASLLRMILNIIVLLIFSGWLEFNGSVNLMATDEFGSQFLRRFLDRATFRETVTIFRQVFYHFIHLATDPFGNFFVHKFLEVCNEEEKIQILGLLISQPKRMIKISVNTYGRRVVHKLIEAVRTKEQMIRLLQAALNPAFLSLVREYHVREYHVIQRFLRPLNHNDNINKFIFEEAAMRLCTEIATHRHGSCELKRCVSYSLGAHSERLAAAPFGNYLEEDVLFELRGRYVELATHKFSSPVVEKYLRYYPERRSQIVHKLTFPNFEHLLQDPFANYLIQSALSLAKGVGQKTWEAKVGPYGNLKTIPYCKIQEPLEDVT